MASWKFQLPCMIFVFFFITLFWYLCFSPHWLKDSVPPVWGNFCNQFFYLIHNIVLNKYVGESNDLKLPKSKLEQEYSVPISNVKLLHKWLCTCVRKFSFLTILAYSNVIKRKNWRTQYFCENRMKVKANIGEYNIFLNPDLRWKPKSVNTTFFDLKPRFSYKSTSVSVYHLHQCFL